MRILLIPMLVLTSAAGAQEVRYEHLFTIGARGGINPTQKFAGAFGKLFFGAPDGVSPLVAPDSVTVDPDERIWITDPGSASVHMFDVVGKKYKALHGSGKADFKCPAGIDSDINGRIYVADSCTGQVFVFEKTGEFDRFLFKPKSTPLLSQPAGLAVSADLKSIYVADPPARKVLVFNQEGETIREIGGPDQLQRPIALALDSDRVFVLDAGGRRVQVFSPGGGLLQSLKWGQIRKLGAFAYDAGRKLFLVGDQEYATVQVFSQERNSVGIFGESGDSLAELHSPSSIYVDAKGRIYVVDSLSGKVLVFGPAASANSTAW